MNEINFVDRVKKHFRYLETEYAFKISLESNSDIRPQTDGMVEYTSDTTAVVIDSETGSAAVWFYRLIDGKKYYLTPIDIYEYLNTSAKEKELLLSTNPKDKLAAAALFNQKFLLSQPGWSLANDTTQNRLERRLLHYSNWLKAHAKLCLEGDFSQWPKFYEYKIYRTRADQLRHGKDELVYAKVKDADGNYQLVKQSAFRDKFEHIEKLKREFQDK